MTTDVIDDRVETMPTFPVFSAPMSSTSFYGNLNFSTTFDGYNYAWNVKLGLRVNW